MFAGCNGFKSEFMDKRSYEWGGYLLIVLPVIRLIECLFWALDSSSMNSIAIEHGEQVLCLDNKKHQSSIMFDPHNTVFLFSQMEESGLQ